MFHTSSTTKEQNFEDGNNNRINNEDNKHGLPVGDIENQTNQRNEGSFLHKQLFAAIGPLLLSIACGLNTGFSATLLPELQAANSTIPITLDQKSWIASVSLISSPVGALLAGLCTEKIGRRLANIVGCPLISLSWASYMWAENFGMIISSRFATGLLTGYTMVAEAVYTAEITSPKYRGMLLSFVIVNVNFGVLVMHTIGTYLTWKKAALIACLIPLPALIPLFFSPESPHWLIKKGRKQEGEAAFLWLRGNSPESQEELRKLNEQKAKEGNRRMFNMTDLKSPCFWRPMFTLCLIGFTVHWSGAHSIEYYSIDLIKKSIGDKEYLLTLVMDAIRVFFCIMACVLARIINRRPHVMVTGGIGGVSMIIFSILLHISAKHDVGDAVKLIMLLIYIACVTAGLASIYSVIGSEIFPLQYRGAGFAIAAAIIHLLAFTVVKLAPMMTEYWGIAWTFGTYGICYLIGTTILFFILPETKGKPLVEIESYLKK